MFIITSDGIRINLSLVKHFWPDEPNQDGLITCRFEFVDGTGQPGTISREQLAAIDATAPASPAKN